MDPCIQPSCSCQAYKAPKNSKGTLLQLRLGCLDCSHQASEHRKLTSIDRYIEREVTKATKCGQCSHQIPTREIPLSPVFGHYDLIPLPCDDGHSVADQENAIQCTCTGFQVQSLVRLWQKFRTHTLDTVQTTLPNAICSFCQHPMADHLQSKKNEMLSLTISKSTQGRCGFKKLVAKESTKITFAPLSNKCVLLVLPETFDGCMTLVAIGKSSDPTKTQLELVTVSQCFNSKKSDKENDIISEGKVPSTCREGTDTNSQVDSTLSIENSGKISPLEQSKISSQAQENGKSEGVFTDQDVKMSSSISAGVSNENSGCNKLVSKKGTKRKRNSNSAAASEERGTRKSARLAAKKQKIEVDVTTSSSSKTSSDSTAKQQLRVLKASRTRLTKMKQLKRHLTPGALHFESVRAVEEEEECPSKVDLERAEESDLLFAQLLKNQESYKTQCTLPADLSPSSNLLMAAQSIRHNVVVDVDKQTTEERVKNSSQDDNSDPVHRDGGLLVAVCADSTNVVHITVVYPDSSRCKREGFVPVWTSVNFAPTDVSSKLSSLSWSRVSIGDNPPAAYFSAGTINGDVYIWRVKLSSDGNKIKDPLLLVSQRNTRSQISVCSWSPNARLLVAGTLLGEVVVYQVEGETTGGDKTKGSAIPLPPLPSERGTVNPLMVVEHLQSIQCCGGSVTCASWSRNSRLVAIGATDDCIQILQCKEPVKLRPPPPSASSLLNYFKRDDSGRKQKFVHTHSLRGHQSFIADVKFLGRNHSLVSIGWDGQVLLWSNLLLSSLPKSQLPSHHHHHHHHHTPHKELPYTEVEPQRGYKLGPSAVVEFLPLSVHPLMGCGLVALLENKLGGFTVSSYLKQL